MKRLFRCFGITGTLCVRQPLISFHIVENISIVLTVSYVLICELKMCYKYKYYVKSGFHFAITSAKSIRSVNTYCKIILGLNVFVYSIKFAKKGKITICTNLSSTILCY